MKKDTIAKNFKVPSKEQSSARSSLPDQHYNSELEAAQKKFQDIIENLEDMVFEMDSTGRIQYVSPNIETILGYKPEDIIGEIPTKFMPPDEAREKYARFVQLAAENKKIKSLEITYFHKNGHLVTLEGSAVPFFAKDGKLLGYRGVNRDVTESRRLKSALQESEEAVKALVNAATHVIILLKTSGTILALNKEAAEKLGGSEQSELIGRCVYDLLPAEVAEIRRARAEEVVRTGQGIQFVDQQGGIWIASSVYPIFDSLGRVNRLAVFAKDITEEKTAEENLKQSEQRFRSYFESPLVGMVITSPDKGWIKVNEKMCSMLGYSHEELVTMTWAQLTHPDDLEADVEQFNRLLSGQIESYSMDKRFLRKDGTFIWTNIAVSCIRGADGEVKQIAGSALDITERKRVEQELRERQQDLNRAQAQAHTGSWRVNLRNNELLWSDEAHRIFNTRMGAPMTYEAFLSSVHPEDREYVDTEWQKALKGEPYDIEHRIVTGDEIKWVRERAELEFDNSGNLLGGFGTVQDITERKKLEKAIRESEERFRSAFDQTAVPMVMTAIDNRLIRVNAAYSKMLGYSESELAGMNFYDITHPDDIEVNRPGVDRVMSGEEDSFRMEKRYIRKDGRVIWVDMSTSSVRDENGKPLYLVTYAQDITERKNAAEQVLERENDLQLVINTLPALVSYVDSNFHYRRVNESYKRWFGLNKCDIEGRHVKSVLGEASWELIRPRLERAMAGETVVYEEHMPYPLGGPRWTKATFVPDFDKDGRVKGIVALVTDITEQKLSEKELSKSRSMLARAEELANLGSWEWDMLSGQMTWSDNSYRLAGEVPGRFIPTYESALEFIHPDYREIVERALESALAGDGHFSVEYKVITRSATRWIHQLGETKFNDEGSPISMIGTVLDITDRKRAEEALHKINIELEDKVQERTAQLTELNKSLLLEIEERKRTEAKLLAAQKNLRAMASEIVLAEERSRQHFATDLHDTVVQTLGAAKLRAQLIENEIPKKALPLLADLQAMISDSILQSRAIMAEMSPPVLNELGIISALEWITEQVGSRYGMHMEFKGRKRKALLLARDIEVLLFQATRELLMNVIKHSNANAVTVKFSSRGQNVRVQVSDNGIGFNMNKTFRPDLKGGFGLYSIRERLQHIGGKLTINSKPGHGTTVLISAPREIEK